MAIKSIQHKQHTFDIGYEIVNPNAKVDLIVLHGWGSSKAIMKKNFEKEMDTFRHIYIDLPGFGKSTCPVALTTADVARIVELLLIHINAEKCIIMGHSFGGKVALLLDPKVLILLSSAGIYRTKSLKVMAKIMLFKTLKIFGFSKLRSLFVAEDAKTLSEHMYQTFKNVVDENFAHDFSLYGGKALLCWGKDDAATPLSSAKEIDTLIKDSKLEVYEGDHFFFTQHVKEISKSVERTFLETLGA